MPNPRLCVSLANTDYVKELSAGWSIETHRVEQNFRPGGFAAAGAGPSSSGYAAQPISGYGTASSSGFAEQQFSQQGFASGGGYPTQPVIAYGTSGYGTSGYGAFGYNTGTNTGNGAGFSGGGYGAEYGAAGGGQYNVQLGGTYNVHDINPLPSGFSQQSQASSIGGHNLHRTNPPGGTQRKQPYAGTVSARMQPQGKIPSGAVAWVVLKVDQSEWVYMQEDAANNSSYLEYCNSKRTGQQGWVTKIKPEENDFSGFRDADLVPIGIERDNENNPLYWAYPIQEITQSKEVEEGKLVCMI
jgi:hypothetical protein